MKVNFVYAIRFAGKSAGWWLRALWLTALLCSLVWADGELDPRFAPRIVSAGSVKVILVQTDGKVLLGGSFTTVNGEPRRSLARLNADGSLDATFNASGTTISINAYGLAQQTNGRVLVNGFLPNLSGTHLIRLLADGSRDESFPRLAAYSFLVQPDGKILTTTLEGVRRYSADGVFEKTVYTPPPFSGVSSGGITIALQPDGKLLVSGGLINPIGSGVKFFVRLLTDGMPDNSFAPMMEFGQVYSYKLIVQPDGKILTPFNGGGLARLNANGSLDTTFVFDQPRASQVNDFLLQPDGRVVVVGVQRYIFDPPTGYVQRLNANGSPDASFPAVSLNAFAETVGRQADGKLFVGGGFTRVGGELRVGLARLQTDGRLDTAFQLAFGGAASVPSVALTPEGKIVMGGDFLLVNGVEKRGLTRLNADGTLDTGFVLADSPGDAHIRFVIQPDGKMLTLTYDRATTRYYVRRWLVNGALDSSYQSPTINFIDRGFMTLQADGKVLLSGAASGEFFVRYIRLNANGSTDDSFTPPGNLGEFIAQERQADGSILVAGTTTSNQNTKVAFVFLKAEGAQDSLREATLPSGTRVLQVAGANGKLIVGGVGTAPDKLIRNFVARFNRDGTPDATFATAWLKEYFFDSQQTSYLSALAVQPDGKVLVGGGGGFGLVRLNANGTLDKSLNFNLFSFTSSTSDVIQVMRLQPDGQLLLGGIFERLGPLPPGAFRTSLARVRLGLNSVATATSAASYALTLAPDSIASVFGVGLADATSVAAALPLPDTLAGVTLKLTDRLAIERRAPLFFVSPLQLNFQVPPATALGAASFVIELNGSPLAAGTVNIAVVAPGWFTFNADGKGVPAGYALRIRNGAQTTEAIHQLGQLGQLGANQRWEPRPIDLGPAGDQVFLVLYGTGLRARSALTNANVLIGNADAEVTYAGAQGSLAGLDQVNVRLPRTLAGRGEVEALMTVDSKQANTVKLWIK